MGNIELKNKEFSLSVWHIYLIRNKLNQLYCGITKDVNRRFKEHSTNSPKGAKALKGKGPLTLEFHLEVGNKSTASKLEAQVKKLKKDRKEELLKSNIQHLDTLTQYLLCHLCKG